MTENKDELSIISGLTKEEEKNLLSIAYKLVSNNPEQKKFKKNDKLLRSILQLTDQNGEIHYLLLGLRHKKSESLLFSKEIVDHLGSGCFGSVKKGLPLKKGNNQFSLEEQKAIKIIEANRPSILNYSKKEFATVCKFFDISATYCERKNEKNITKYYIEMCYVEGQDIENIDFNNKDPHEKSSMSTKIFIELEPFHNQGYIHGDIHGGNIRFNTKTNQMKLLDMGKTRKSSDASVDITSTVELLAKIVFAQEVSFDKKSKQYVPLFYHTVNQVLCDFFNAVLIDKFIPNTKQSIEFFQSLSESKIEQAQGWFQKVKIELLSCPFSFSLDDQDTIPFESDDSGNKQSKSGSFSFWDGRNIHTNSKDLEKLKPTFMMMSSEEYS